MYAILDKISIQLKKKYSKDKLNCKDERQRLKIYNMLKNEIQMLEGWFSD